MTALTLPGSFVSETAGRDLVEKAAAGDLGAFEALYRSHVTRIHSLVRRMAGPAEADDLTQDVFIRVWQKLTTFRGESAFGTWLHRLAVNLVIERLRSRGNDRLRWAESDSALASTASRQSSPATRMGLDAALERLPDGARTVFVLHDVEGRTHQEIAGLLGVSAGTSKAQLHRARLLMRRHLG
jgi:RNA polymerase sigma-70 factor, ECF subfamily